MDKLVHAAEANKEKIIAAAKAVRGLSGGGGGGTVLSTVGGAPPPTDLLAVRRLGGGHAACQPSCQTLLPPAPHARFARRPQVGGEKAAAKVTAALADEEALKTKLSAGLDHLAHKPAAGGATAPGAAPATTPAAEPAAAPAAAQ